MFSRSRTGISLLEVALSTGIVGIVLAIGLPILLQARSSARQMQCASKLGKIAQANAQYEAQNGRFPPGRRVPDYEINGIARTNYSSYGSVDPNNPDSRLGHQTVHLWLLPALGFQEAFDLFDPDVPYCKIMVLAGKPFNPNLGAIELVGNFYVCPDDSNTSPGGVTENNYRYNFGGATPNGGAASTSNQTLTNVFDAEGAPVGGNGAFTIGMGFPASVFRRGLSNTVFFSERTKGTGFDPSSELPGISDLVTMDGRTFGAIGATELFQKCSETVLDVSQFNFNSAGRWLPGSIWSNGWAVAGYDSVEYNHVVPPNWDHVDCGSFSAIPDTPGEHAVIAARSEHGTFVHVAYGDAHVATVSNAIDLALWRSLGRRDRPGKVDPPSFNATR